MIISWVVPPQIWGQKSAIDPCAKLHEQECCRGWGECMPASTVHMPHKLALSAMQMSFFLLLLFWRVRGCGAYATQVGAQTVQRNMSFCLCVCFVLMCLGVGAYMYGCVCLWMCVNTPSSLLLSPALCSAGSQRRDPVSNRGNQQQMRPTAGPACLPHSLTLSLSHSLHSLLDDTI